MDGFRITCLHCLSTNVEEIQDYDYSTDGTKYDKERYFLCKECGQSTKVNPVYNRTIKWNKSIKERIWQEKEFIIIKKKELKL